VRRNTKLIPRCVLIAVLVPRLVQPKLYKLQNKKLKKLIRPRIKNNIMVFYYCIEWEDIYLFPLICK